LPPWASRTYARSAETNGYESGQAAIREFAAVPNGAPLRSLDNYNDRPVRQSKHHEDVLIGKNSGRHSSSGHCKPTETSVGCSSAVSSALAKLYARRQV
jgi:hypothetical protein